MYLKFVPVVILFVYINLTAQTGSYNISGVIKNEKNWKIPDVHVTLISTEDEDKKITHIYSDKDGKFSFPDLTADKYKLLFYHVSYKLKDIVINLNKNINLIVELEDTLISTKNYVVTGTRTLKDIKSNPIPTDVINQKEIKETGSIRLDDILSEQVGLNLIEDHGKGVQIQGLDASFALIMLNSEPVIGTMTGKLNLERFSLGNIKRLEVVKGPSSSLYGSNALAGVINLITEKPNYSGVEISGRYGTFNTLDLGLNAFYYYEPKDFSISFYANSLSSDGFQLTFSNIKQTVASFSNYTLSTELFISPFLNTEATIRARFNQENQTNQFGVNPQDTSSSLNDKGIMRDINLSLGLKHHLSGNANLNFKLYGTYYSTETEFFSNKPSDEYNTNFYQKLGKAEIVYDRLLFASNLFMVGMGATAEQVNSDIISEGSRTSRAFFGFIQDDWYITDNLNIIGSLRYDRHSDYKSSLNPKIAVSYKFLEYFTVRGSVGSGFKAPTFEQLYLNWNNPTSGYSVYGVAYLKDGLRKLQELGLIQEILIQPENLGEINPENSWSFNIGTVFDLNQTLNLSVNLFRNNVRDLIDFLRIGTKSNGLGLYTYSNFSRVHTQGIEAELNLSFIKFLDISFNYQYLTTADEDILEQIKEGKIFKRGSTGIDRAVQESEYGGLFNRSEHTGNVKIRYSNPDIGFSVSLRGNIRGKYGYKDLNSNNILDDTREYAPGYALWHITLSQDLFNKFTIQGGIKNILDRKDQKMLTFEPGRTMFLSVTFKHNL